MANKPKDVKDKNETPKKFEIVSIDMLPKDMTITPGIMKVNEKGVETKFDTNNAIAVKAALSTMLEGKTIKVYPGGKDEHKKQRMASNKRQQDKQREEDDMSK